MDELGRPVESWWFELSDESGRSGGFERLDDHLGRLMNMDGHLSGIVPVHADGEFELRQQYLPRLGLKEIDPFTRTRFVPVKVSLNRSSDRLDLGTLVLPRMACVKLTLIDGSDGMAIGTADVRMRCTGGGQPPEDFRPDAEDDGSYDVLSGRSSGEYELKVKAPGYQPVERVGVLVAGDEPQRLELVLERSR